MHCRALLLAALVVPAAAFAQDEELGLGLDLTEPSTPAEFKPSLAILGVVPAASEGGDAAVLTARAEAVNFALLPAAMANEPFSRVLSEEDAKTALGEGYAAAQTCVAVECLAQLADKLEVDRVITGQLSYSNGETKLSLTGYDRGTNKIFTAEAESAEKAMRKQLSGFSGIGGGKSQAAKDREFLAKTTAPIYALVGDLKTPLGAIDVRSYEPDVVVTLNGKTVGTGSFSKTLPAGEYALHAESPSVFPYDAKVTVESLKTVEVALQLTARPKNTAPVVVAEKPSNQTPIYKRPGLYVAVVGAVALGIGAALGSSAKGVERRATDADNDGVLDVTRAEAMNAKSTATLATILMGTGGAALVGGGIWMFAAPGTERVQTIDGPVVEPEGAGGGFTIGVGGRF